jgi:hypothetical protein
MPAMPYAVLLIFTASPICKILDEAVSRVSVQMTNLCMLERSRSKESCCNECMYMTQYSLIVFPETDNRIAQCISLRLQASPAGKPEHSPPVGYFVESFESRYRQPALHDEKCHAQA